MNTSIYTNLATGQRYLVVAIEVPAKYGVTEDEFMAAWADDVGNCLDLMRAQRGAMSWPELGELHDAGLWLAELVRGCVHLEKWLWQAKREASDLAKELAEMGRMKAAFEQEAFLLAANLDEMGKALEQTSELLQLIRQHNPGIRLPGPEALRFREYYKAQEAKGAPVPPEDGGAYCGACGGTREVAEHEFTMVDGFSVPQQTGRQIACPTCAATAQQAEPSDAVAD